MPGTAGPFTFRLICCASTHFWSCFVTLGSFCPFESHTPHTLQSRNFLHVPSHETGMGLAVCLDSRLQTESARQPLHTPTPGDQGLGLAAFRYRSQSVRQDLGRTRLKMVSRHVVQFSWGRGHHSDRIYFTHFRDKSNSQPMLSRPAPVPTRAQLCFDSGP